MKKSTVMIWALIVIMLLGIVGVSVSQIAEVKAKSNLSSIFLSIGCSLLATAVSSTVVYCTDRTTEETIENALRTVGLDVKMIKARNHALSLRTETKPDKINKTTQDAIKKFKIKGPLSVGHTESIPLDSYYDLIGATCNPAEAEKFANLLGSFWKYFSTQQNTIVNPEYDFIVTPKGGSPLLGYEFAKLVKKPFVLFEQTERFHNRSDDVLTWFDCSTIPSKGQTALIVDDSATIGTMLNSAVNHLREYGYLVHTCLVVFTPGVDDAKETLAQNDVQLVSLTQMNNKQAGAKRNIISFPELPMDIIDDKRLEELIIVKPHRIFMDISWEGCGNNCTYCYVDSKKRTQDLLSNQEIQRLCQLAEERLSDEFNVITLCPNTEPLKSPEAIRSTQYICQYFIARGCYVQISTKERVPEKFLIELNRFADKRIFINVSIPVITDFKTFEPYAPDASERLNNFKLISKYPNIISCLYIKPFMKSASIDTSKFIEAINNFGIGTVCVGVCFNSKDDKPCKALHDHNAAKEIFDSQKELLDRFIMNLRTNTDASIFGSSFCCVCNVAKSDCLLKLFQFDTEVCHDCGCYNNPEK